MRTISVSLALTLSAGLAGCTADPGSEADLADGKLDGAGLVNHTSPIQEIREIGSTFTDSARAHAWTFHLGMQEDVSLYTALFSGSEGDELNTVLYLYEKQADGGWGHYIRKNDDASPNTKWSRLDVSLEPGDYRIIVKAYNDQVMGQFAINMQCADGVCEWVAPNGDEEDDAWGKGEADPTGVGAVSLRVPVLDMHEKPMSKHNQALEDAGLEPFPDYVTISSTDADPGAEYKNLWDRSLTDEVLAVTGDEMDAFYSPGALDLCYDGDGTALIDLMGELGDNVFSDQLGLYGWQADGKSAYLEFHEPTTESPSYDDWRAFDAGSNDVFLIYSVDDDGNEQTTTVPPCP